MPFSFRALLATAGTSLHSLHLVVFAEALFLIGYLWGTLIRLLFDYLAISTTTTVFVAGSSSFVIGLLIYRHLMKLYLRILDGKQNQ